LQGGSAANRRAARDRASGLCAGWPVRPATVAASPPIPVGQVASGGPTCGAARHARAAGHGPALDRATHARWPRSPRPDPARPTHCGQARLPPTRTRAYGPEPATGLPSRPGRRAASAAPPNPPRKPAHRRPAPTPHPAPGSALPQVHRILRRSRSPETAVSYYSRPCTNRVRCADEAQQQRT
jgi:hypothetical protein